MKILKRFLWLIVLLCMVAPGNAWDTFPLRAGGIHPSLGPGGDILVATYTEAAKLSMDGTYDFLWPTSDISAYAGVEGTRATHMAHVWDSAGKRAIAYLGAAGAGETLGGELLTSLTNNASTNQYETFDVIGVEISSAINSSGEGRAVSNDMVSLPKGALFKYTGNLTLNSGDGPIIAIGANNAGGNLSPAGGNTSALTDGANSKYVTQGGIYTYIGLINTGNASFALAGSSFQKVTDCAVTGLHCFSDITCNTRGYVSDTGIDPNAATKTIQIFKLR